MSTANLSSAVFHSRRSSRQNAANGCFRDAREDLIKIIDVLIQKRKEVTNEDTLIAMDKIMESLVVEAEEVYEKERRVTKSQSVKIRTISEKYPTPSEEVPSGGPSPQLSVHEEPENEFGRSILDKKRDVEYGILDSTLVHSNKIFDNACPHLHETSCYTLSPSIGNVRGGGVVHIRVNAAFMDSTFYPSDNTLDSTVLVIGGKPCASVGNGRFIYPSGQIGKSVVELQIGPEKIPVEDFLYTDDAVIYGSSYSKTPGDDRVTNISDRSFIAPLSGHKRQEQAEIDFRLFDEEISMIEYNGGHPPASVTKKDSFETSHFHGKSFSGSRFKEAPYTVYETPSDDETKEDLEFHSSRPSLSRKLLGTDKVLAPPSYSIPLEKSKDSRDYSLFNRIARSREYMNNSVTESNNARRPISTEGNRAQQYSYSNYVDGNYVNPPINEYPVHSVNDDSVLQRHRLHPIFDTSVTNQIDSMGDRSSLPISGIPSLETRNWNSTSHTTRGLFTQTPVHPGNITISSNTQHALWGPPNCGSISPGDINSTDLLFHSVVTPNKDLGYKSNTNEFHVTFELQRVTAGSSGGTLPYFGVIFMEGIQMDSDDDFSKLSQHTTIHSLLAEFPGVGFGGKGATVVPGNNTGYAQLEMNHSTLCSWNVQAKQRITLSCILGEMRTYGFAISLDGQRSVIIGNCNIPFSISVDVNSSNRTEIFKRALFVMEMGHSLGGISVVI